MEKRTCKICGDTLSADKFPFTGYVTKAGKRLRRRACGKCYYKTNTIKQAEKMRDWLEDYKKNNCICECGESDHRCLDFHHLNPEEKLFDISTKASRGYGKDALLREIAKCKVLCSNCHRKLNYDKVKAGALERRAGRSVGRSPR